MPARKGGAALTLASAEPSSFPAAGAAPAPRLTGALLASTLIAALGGLLFGFDTAVISGTTEQLKRVFGLGSFSLGFTVASALIGTILGAMAAGRPSDAYGRRAALFAIASLYFVSGVGCGLAWSWSAFLLFRFIGGIGIGAASVVSPMYIAEIAPASLRGRLVALTQFNIVLGILLAFVSNYVIAGLGLGEADWRLMVGVSAVPSAGFFALLFLTPESPRWLVARGREAEARAVMSRLGVASPAVEREIAAIRGSLDLEHHSLEEPFFQRAYRQPILLVIAIAAFNQFSGINAVMYYAPAIFAMTGAAKDRALLQSVIIGGTNLLFTMAAMAVIDHFGRRRLMLVGSVGYIASLVATAWAFYTYGTAFTPFGSAVVLASLLVFIAAHAFGQGAVIWVFISEIFPTRVRARGQALGSFTHWVMAAAISWSFPMIAEASGGHAFAFYAVMMVGQLLWVLRAMPETKGVALEDIQRRLGID
jgi:sugar porter (SP) family MFS transporter